jgi:NAD(P)-dependent dehydrogenase (short-subunit alcohol dehydrogenase family)
MPSLKDKTVLIIGRGSGIARAIAMAVSEDGGRVIVAGRHPDDLAAAYHGLDMGVEQVDVTDESSIAALAGRIAAVDHVVCTASARARGAYRDLTASTVNASFGTKVTGPPGTIDTGAYDALGDERKAALFKTRSETAPARRIGTADDIAAVALAVLANGYLTGASIPVDGGEHLV